MSEKRFSLLAVIGLYSILFLLSLILLLLFDTLLAVINVASDTPSEPISVHLITRVLKGQVLLLRFHWILHLVIFVVGFTITCLVLKYASSPETFLRVISVAVIIFSIFRYLTLKQPCEGLECIYVGFILLFAEASWLIAGASVPILLLSIWGRTENLLSHKKFWLTEILVLISISIIWFLTTSPLIVRSVKNFSIAKSQIQKIYSDPTFPVYEPTYLPAFVGKLENEYVYDSGDYVLYMRVYRYGPTGHVSFVIEELKPKVSKSNEQNLQEDLNELRARQSLFADNEFYKYNPEVITINGNPALIYPEDILGDKVFLVLQLYVEGVRIRISVPVGLESEPLSKEELIKIAESLKRKN